MMKKLLLATLALMATSPAMAQFFGQPECRLDADVPNVAINCPSMFAWQLFAEVLAPVGDGLVTFQIWSSDGDTFQCPPADLETCHANPDAPGCPVWPTGPSTKLARGTSGPKAAAFLTGVADDFFSYHQPDNWSKSRAVGTSPWTRTARRTA